MIVKRVNKPVAENVTEQVLPYLKKLLTFLMSEFESQIKKTWTFPWLRGEPSPLETRFLSLRGLFFLQEQWAGHTRCEVSSGWPSDASFTGHSVPPHRTSRAHFSLMSHIVWLFVKYHLRRDTPLISAVRSSHVALISPAPLRQRGTFPLLPYQAVRNDALIRQTT